MSINYYRYALGRAIEFWHVRLSVFQVGPDAFPVARYVALDWHHGAGFPDGWTSAFRVERLREDTLNYFAPFVIWPRRTWKGIQRQIWSGRHDKAKRS